MWEYVGISVFYIRDSRSFGMNISFLRINLFYDNDWFRYKHAKRIFVYTP